ncbi:MAG: ribonuclease H-like domain-containing protein [Anaerolineales bacterium]|nr:ribonuclease H-like domain-containing protein [Anaerolineales bacterium]
MKLASFDIEIASVIPEGTADWAEYPDLGISCAAVAFEDREEVRFWSGVPRLDPHAARLMAQELIEIHKAGYQFVTWNGCGFDFRVLAQESGMVEEMALLAMEHVDLMLMVTFAKGHYLSLQKALEGAGMSGKLKRVRLSDGGWIEDMDGSQAPILWGRGEQEAVLAYLEQDVRQQLALAQWVRTNRQIRWTSSRGNPQSASFNKLLTVKQCFALPEPDTSWMRDPPTREQFTAWMGA